MKSTSRREVGSAVSHVSSPTSIYFCICVFKTTYGSLRSLYATYGKLDEAIVIFDKNTAKSKGYDFVTVKNADGALLALKEPSKKIDDRITVTEFAAAGVDPVAPPASGD